jgi:hypothetical protein
MVTLAPPAGRAEPMGECGSRPGGRRAATSDEVVVVAH